MKTLVMAGTLVWIDLIVGPARAQQDVPKARADEPGATGPATIESINRDFERELAGLERQRLERLARLAAGQGRGEAESTYETYFRLAIAGGLFGEAEPTAERVLRSANAASPAASLAAIVNIVAEADRGAYRESLESLAAALGGRGNQGDAAAGPRVSLPRTTLLKVAEAYYQRLVQAGQFEMAREGLQMIRDRADDPALKDYAANHLAQLDLIGKPAPPVVGTGLDGKPVSLADFRGDVVLIVFWATWYVPGVEEVAQLDRVYEAHRGRGFRILGINVDTAQDGATQVETVLPNVRRFLLDYNVRWPNLINGRGEQDYARAYAVTEIPANFLIGRDGRVIRLDLNRSNLEQAVAGALGR